MIALLALLAAAQVALPPKDPGKFQMMTSPAFETFAKHADAVCPARHLRLLKPADLDGHQETFEQTLTPRQRHRLAAADAGMRGCANQMGGLSCPAQHRLAAMVRLGMLESFVRNACRTPD